MKSLGLLSTKNLYLYRKTHENDKLTHLRFLL